MMMVNASDVVRNQTNGGNSVARLIAFKSMKSKQINTVCCRERISFRTATTRQLNFNVSRSASYKDILISALSGNGTYKLLLVLVLVLFVFFLNPMKLYCF